MLQRLSQLDWPRLLYTRRAAILLGIAAVLSVFTLVIIRSNVDEGKLGFLADIAFNTAAAVGPAGLLTLLVCMAFFWLKCDSSSKTWRTIWFLVLLFGFLFGSAVAYYALVYLPAVRKKLRNPEVEIGDFAALEPIWRDNERIGPFRRSLLIAWGVGLLAVVMVLFLPKPVPTWLLAPVVIVSFLLSATAVVEAAIHVFVSFYRSGISRPSTSGQPRSPRAPNRDR